MAQKLLFVFLWTLCCISVVFSNNHEDAKYWRDEAKAELARAQKLEPNIAVAKNVILFLGDGMGMSTITAARILKGQMNNRTGEETILNFEKFPRLGLAKTYNQDAQTPDSAATSAAFHSGIKTNFGTVGCDSRVVRGNCNSTKGAEVTSILDWSLAKGKSVGIVTTTRVTHATPSAAYAHIAERDWESDADMLKKGNPGDCKDIARQLVEDNIDINVILGGGRQSFLRFNDTDPEGEKFESHGRRDNRNLIEAWENAQKQNGRKYKYVWNAADFRSTDVQETDYLLGLFGSSHMQFETDRDNNNEPSLAEMTEMAVKILRKNKNGYYLLVEGGRIDHAHHDNKPKKALVDTVAFDTAVEKGVDITSESDTLIVVTADHSHTFAISGYPTRGSPILGKVDRVMFGNSSTLALDNLPFTTLQYANGPGHNVTNGKRLNVTDIDTADKEYVSQSAVPLGLETHAGEDVAIYARGPMSQLFHGTHEQHYISHVMAFASCVGDYSNDNDCAKAVVAQHTSGASKSPESTYMIYMVGAICAAFCNKFVLF